MKYLRHLWVAFLLLVPALHAQDCTIVGQCRGPVPPTGTCLPSWIYTQTSPTSTSAAVYACTGIPPAWHLQSGTGGGASLPNTTLVFKGDNAGGAVAATPGTDYLLPNGSGAALTGLAFTQLGGNLGTSQGPLSLTGLLKDITGTISAAVAGTDYVIPSGNVATATALQTTPTQCTGGQFATGVAASGNANCSTPAGGGNVSGPVSSSVNNIAAYNNTSGTLIKDSGIAISSLAANPLTASGDVWGGGTSGAPARIAAASGTASVPETLVETPGGTASFQLPGIAGSSVTTTYTVLATDRGHSLDFNSTSATAITLPSAASFGSNFNFVVQNENYGPVTITPTTSTINGNSSIVLNVGDICAFNSPDNTNYSARCATNNNEFVVGPIYTTLNAAFAAAKAAAIATGTNQTVRLGPGTYPVTATLSEPTSGGICVNIIGSSNINTLLAGGTNITVPSSLGGDVINLLNAAGTPANGCVFQGFNLNAGANATHGFELQYCKGLVMQYVSVVDTTDTAILLGETSGSDQNNVTLRDISISYQSGTFQPNTRPNIGLDLQATTHDSYFDNILVRNALNASVHTSSGSGGNHWKHVHGFGFPYSCTTPPCITNATNKLNANASYATNYIIQDAGSNDHYEDSYLDSPAISGIDVQASKFSAVGGTAFWLDGVSFPAGNVATIESTATFAVTISNINAANLVAPYFTFNSTPTQSAFFGMTGVNQTGVWPSSAPVLATDSKGQVIAGSAVASVAVTAPITNSGTSTAPNIGCTNCVGTTAPPLTANQVVLGANSQNVVVAPGIATDGISQLTLGVAGTSVGAVNLHNGNSGTLSIQPPTGVLGTHTQTLQAVADTFVYLGTTDTLTNKTMSGASNTFSAIPGSALNNNSVTATQLAAQYSKGSCTEVWGGSGTSFALTSGDDEIANNTCFNDSGVTRTITAVKCRSDVASNTTTVAPVMGSAGSGTSILSGALTCGSSLAYSATGTLSGTSWTTGTGINPVMGGTLTGTSIAVIIEYTY